MEKSIIVLIIALMIFFLILKMKKVDKRPGSNYRKMQDDYSEKEYTEEDNDDEENEFITETKEKKETIIDFDKQENEKLSSSEKTCEQCLSFKSFTCPGQKRACQFFRPSTPQDDLKNNIYRM